VVLLYTEQVKELRWEALLFAESWQMSKHWWISVDERVWFAKAVEERMKDINSFDLVTWYNVKDLAWKETFSFRQQEHSGLTEIWKSACESSEFRESGGVIVTNIVFPSFGVEGC
jgi:hypothetical protein